MKYQEFQRCEKTIRLYPAPGPAPIVFDSQYEEDGQELLEAAAGLGCPPFHLVTVSRLNWDRELSPWPHAPLVSPQDQFTGGADGYIAWLENEIIPWAEEALRGRITCRLLAGYSMAGLLAAYAPFRTEAFDAFACVSGSVWYPDFQAYFMQHPFLKAPRAMYFSLGDRETRARNPYLKTTASIMGALADNCTSRGVSATFETNPGNHFRDPALRTAKGISWLLRRISGGDISCT